MIEADKIKLSSITETPIITIEEAGEWLNLGSEGTSFQSSLLLNLIKSAQRSVENYLWYDLNEKVYIALFDIEDLTSDDEFILQKTPITSVDKIEYLNVDNVWTEITKGTEIVANEIYDNVNIKEDMTGYLRLKLKNDYELSDEGCSYKFRVTFTAGYDITKTYLVPEDIKTALKEIVEYNYLNRGENKNTAIPASTKEKIDKYSIAKTVIN